MTQCYWQSGPVALGTGWVALAHETGYAKRTQPAPSLHGSLPSEEDQVISVDNLTFVGCS